MDIFTTQLARVVPVQIKPANLKVKALVKDSAAGKLKEDPEHLEDHNDIISSYQRAPSDKEHLNPDNKSSNDDDAVQSEDTNKIDDKSASKDKSQLTHLDIFV